MIAQPFAILQPPASAGGGGGNDIGYAEPVDLEIDFSAGGFQYCESYSDPAVVTFTGLQPGRMVRLFIPSASITPFEWPVDLTWIGLPLSQTSGTGIGIDVVDLYCGGTTDDSVYAFIVKGLQETMIYKGPWVGLSEAVQLNDVVTNVAATYICILTHHPSTADSEPGIGVDWEDYWALIS